MSIPVTLPMVKAGYQRLRQFSSMVDMVGEAQIEPVLADVFKVMYAAGYGSKTPQDPPPPPGAAPIPVAATSATMLASAPDAAKT